MLEKILGNEICCKELMLIRKMGNSYDKSVFLFAFLYGSENWQGQINYISMLTAVEIGT